MHEGVGERGSLVPHFGVVLSHDQVVPRAIPAEERECVRHHPVAIGEQLGDFHILAVEFTLRSAQWSPQAGGGTVIGGKLSVRRSDRRLQIPKLGEGDVGSGAGAGQGVYPAEEDPTGRCRRSQVVDQLEKALPLGVEEGQHAENGQTEGE